MRRHTGYDLNILDVHILDQYMFPWTHENVPMAVALHNYIYRSHSRRVEAIFSILLSCEAIRFDSLVSSAKLSHSSQL